MKFVNDPEDIVTEAIDGLVESHPFLNRLDGYPEVKVVVRTDWESPENSRKVAVISGGGAGHEPAHAGFVGKGMLTAAVSGDVFASPSTFAILAAIRTVAYPGGESQAKAKESPGVLLIIKNYTGDRINFRLAAEQARAEGIPVEMVVVADDCALPDNKGVTGRRGIAGTALVHKIAGAAAEAGGDLSAVTAEAQAAIDAISSLGVSASVCSVPGRQPDGDRLADDEVEMGLGIHGEPGASTQKIGKIDSMVDEMVRTMLDPSDGRGFVSLSKGDKVAIMVNNLGSSTPLEVSIFTRAALKTLEGMGVDVVRVIAGPLVTSMDMAGLSLSLLKLDSAAQTVLGRLDAETNAPGWPRGFGPRTAGKKPIPVPDRTQKSFSRPESLTEKGKAVESVLAAVSESIERAEPDLTHWDNQVGDGDCGLTHKKGALAIRDDLQNYPLNSWAETLEALTDTISKAMGGTSGVLYRIFFLSLAVSARSLEDQSEPVTTAQLSEALERAVDLLSSSGGATQGDRTMLDSLYPAVHSLQKSAAKGESMLGALEQAVIAAEEGAEATKSMIARAGRSNYVPEEVLKSTPDPGAKAVAIWMRAALNALASSEIVPSVASA